MTTDHTPDDYVLAVDVSPTHAYLAQVFRDGRDPVAHMVRFPALDEARDSNVQRATEIVGLNAKRVLKGVLALGATPRMVCMSKLFLFDMKHDASGPRRAGLWWEVSRLVVGMQAAGGGFYDLAEIAPMTAQRLLTGRTVPGKQGFVDTERGLRALYPTLADDVPDGFRWYVIAEAMVGATALGWSTPCDVNATALSAMRGRVNSFPVDVPKTVDDWKQKNAEHKAVYRNNSTTPKEKIA